jgi:very-short-patch-repair endonuclease
MPRKTLGTADHIIVQAARSNRHEPTPAEARLWAVLRGGRLSGLKFRRQHPIDRFILDFFCAENMLAIEVDGSIHQSAGQPAYDAERTLALNDLGIRVLRFTNQEITSDQDTVLNRILSATNH